MRDDGRLSNAFVMGLHRCLCYRWYLSAVALQYLLSVLPEYRASGWNCFLITLAKASEMSESYRYT